MRIAPLAPAVMVRPLTPVGVREYILEDELDGGGYLTITVPSGIGPTQYVILTSVAVMMWRYTAPTALRYATTQVKIFDGAEGVATLGVYSFRDAAVNSIVTYSHMVNLFMPWNYRVGFYYENRDDGGIVKFHVRVSGLVYNY